MRNLALTMGILLWLFAVVAFIIRLALYGFHFAWVDIPIAALFFAAIAFFAEALE
jgi:hypothetical protein